ncbi:MAG TPA: alpha amylase, partial [Opitutae bacterium]|nr:alpha amylase [Opitutae bacterium]
MKSHFLKLLTFLSLLAPSFAHEGPWTASRPDGHGPISVMGDHMHAMGEWMVSYRYMTMDMETLLKGANSVSVDSQLGTTSVGDFRMVPTAMKMDMHMFGLMHAISDKWTLMGMVNYLDNEMDMIMHFMEMGGMTMRHDHEMAAESSGLGDLKLVGLYDLAKWNNGRRIHLNLGLSIPTGSIDEKSGADILGYGMQLGSGTWDFNPAITFLGQTDKYSWGAQIGGTFRIGENDQDYALGDNFCATLWGARTFTDSLSASAKFDFSSQD